MTKLQPVIKWTGSKRLLANDILQHFPSFIETYYEPFCGGGSVMFALLHSNIKINKIICSDINGDLIGVMNTIKEEPENLIDGYVMMWNELNKDDDIERRKQYYYNIRKSYNKTRDISCFLFLTRTCINGLIRYNSKGEFNSAFQFGRKGIEPSKFAHIIMDWSNKINQNNVEFLHRDYKAVKPNENDFVFIDPPYINTDTMYFGKFIYDEFWNWMRELTCGYLLTFNGKTSISDNTYEVPRELYNEHKFLSGFRSSFKDMFNSKTKDEVRESLYIKTK